MSVNDIQEMTNEQLEQRLKQNRKAIRQMLIVAISVFLLNVVTVLFFVCYPHHISLASEIGIGITVGGTNASSIWWLCQGGRWR